MANELLLINDSLISNSSFDNENKARAGSSCYDAIINKINNNNNNTTATTTINCMQNTKFQGTE